MNKTKKLSNSFSTGGGGGHFEAHVQASFVALMLTGGYAPCLPCWPIKEIKLQGKIDGFATDDLIVIVENKNNKDRRKLLGQIKHSIGITQGSALFGEVIQAAWNDFNDTNIFIKGKDVIALITGPLSATDAHNVQWLLNQARHTKDVDEFFRNVQQANFSPAKSEEKLDVITHHLKAANGGNDVDRDEIYEFLNHFHLLNYDLGSEFGVVLSLLHSHISQFHQQYPQWAWSRIVDIVQTWNQDSGVITGSKLPEDLSEAFKQKIFAEIPADLKLQQTRMKIDWSQHADASYLALAILIGSWNDKNKFDLEEISQFFGITYKEWLTKAQEILHRSDNTLSLKNGIWTVVSRTELWKILGGRIFDQNLENFKSLVVSVLKVADPAFELPPSERYAARVYGKTLEHSEVFRKGIAEGLAILGSEPESCSSSSLGKVEEVCILVIREILDKADWVIWGSLNSLLPILAEVAPNEFLASVEKSLHQVPCPFDELYTQEGTGISGGHYLTGLLWALEGLAWDEKNLVRVCVLLGELANHDPGGNLVNRPSNSLATILLPWFPQTLASIDKRKVAVRTLLRERPNIAWNLLIQLLPDQRRTSSGSHKPIWRNPIPNDRSKSVTQEEFWEQTSFYAELAVATAGEDVDRLSILINQFSSLPEPSFDQLLQHLASARVTNLPEEKRLEIWRHLTKLTNENRRFSDAEWALPDELITRIEHVAKELAPTNPFNLYQCLFSDRDFELYEESGDWEEQRKKLDIRREAAISEILQQGGIESVIQFGESVASPRQVGCALGVITDPAIEKLLLPQFLDEANGKRRALVNSFTWRRHYANGWEWCDSIDKTGWTLAQIGQFLACLPFTKDAWDRASQWLQENESEYWSRTEANAYQSDGDIHIAVEKLLEHGRAHSAINCLGKELHAKNSINVAQCVRSLVDALSSKEPAHMMDSYHTLELIKFLQSDPSVTEDNLFAIEWAYLPLLDKYNRAAPKLLVRKLASSPEFFCEVIQLIYRSKKEAQPNTVPENSKDIATNAWRLLNQWSTPPGMQQDGTFSEYHFNDWYQRVKEICTESGHLDVAMINMGEVLIHAPADPSGLWIHQAIATALNHSEAENMRRGFSTGTYNSRGAHFVDPTGKPEIDLSKQYHSKAESVENEGFQRFAVTLRGLADGYQREAERIISENKSNTSFKA